MKLYTIDEASEASRMSPSWWRQQIFRKSVRYAKVGRRVFIPESTVKELLEKSIVEPISNRERGKI